MDKESENLVFGCVLEAGLLCYISKSTCVVDGTNGTTNLKENDAIFISFGLVHKDPLAFPELDKIDPQRPIDSYLFFGYDFHRCFGD